MKKYLLLLLLFVTQFHAGAAIFICDIVSGVSSTNITNASANLNWHSLPAAINYDVDYKASSSGSWINAATGTTALTQTITGLSPNTVYDWRVRANCSEGAGPYAPAQFTTGAVIAVCASCSGTAVTAPPADIFNYNTVLAGAGAVWNAKVHLPWDYFLNNNTYPAIIFFPGLGEVGTDISKLLIYGPHKYLAAGWNGNVKIDTDSVKFIIISVQPAAAFPNETLINNKIAYIKSQFRIKAGGLHLTGLSQGGWCSTTFVTGDPYGGPYTYAGQIASVVEVQGIIPDDNQPYPNLFDNFALSGGRLLGFEQPLDGRDIPTRVNRMNATVPNSAIFITTNFGSGGHCCFDNYYGSSVTAPGIFLLDGRSENIYQWMARQ